MPYTFMWEPDGVVKHYSGFVTGAEFVESVIEVTGSGRFDDLLFIINDFTDAEGHGINQDTYEEIAALRYGASQTRNSIRTAISTRDPRFAAIADAVNAELPSGVPRTEVFPTLPLAKEWLAQQPGLPRGRRLHSLER